MPRSWRPFAQFCTLLMLVLALFSTGTVQPVISSKTTYADDQPAAPSSTDTQQPATQEPTAPKATTPAPAGPPLDEARSVTINTLLVYTGDDGHKTGDCSPARITAGGGDGKKVRVGFFESEVGGLEDMWRSAAWSAVIAANMLSDFNPRAMHVAFEYEGRVDGPSAGGLMTIGVLAAVRGDTVRPDVAMTGTINPDGTLGPVGGIPFKIEGAAARGMKLVLIPADKRIEYNPNTKQEVDLVEHGRKLGIEVQPVFDIYTAYELVTGKSLPRAPAASQPRIGPEANAQLQEKMTQWYDWYSEALDSYSKMPGKAKLTQEAVDLYKKGLAIIQHSQEMKREGDYAAVYWDRVHAAAYAYLALELGRCRYTYANDGYQGAVNRLRDNSWLEKDVQKTARRMRRETPKTLDQLSMYFTACDAFLEALCLQQVAKTMLAEMPEEDSDDAQKQALAAAMYQILAWVNLRIAADALDLEGDYEGPPIPANAPWRDTSDYLSHAADANSKVFETVYVKYNAKHEARSEQDYRDELIRQDITYAILQAARNAVIPKLNDYLGNAEAAVYARLASSMYIHIHSAGLIAKYYSLGVELDEDRNVVRLTGERTLSEWLTFAEDQSRRDVALLQNHGVSATPCAQMHEMARIMSRRDLDEKLEALYEFWTIDLHALVLRRLAQLAQQ